MSSASEYSRLCRLINDSLPHYTESELISLNKQKEKDLLIALSQVSREVQLWTYELDSDSYDDVVAHPSFTEKCSENYEEHCCLTRIIVNLIVFLTAESQYVQYLASNVLMVISEFVAVSGSNWKGFVHFLCVCLEVAIGNILSSSLAPQIAAKKISAEKSSFVVFVTPRLKNANWSAVAGIIRLLRNILKHLKQENDDQLEKLYLDSISSCLSNVPWDSLDTVCVGQTGDTQRCTNGDAFSLRNFQIPESRVVFLGNLVQFFCSLVEQSGSLEVQGGSLDKHPVLCNISNVVPKLLYWCLGKQGNCNHLCISQYFKHKLLMLMIRLSSHIPLQYSFLASWLQILHEYFQDLLLQPICQVKPDENGCLEGSPFLYSLLDGEVYSMSLRHLQRQAVFLFLRCSFSLISMREETRDQCACTTTNSCLAFYLNSECYSQKRGLLELHEWLQGHVLKDLVVDQEMYWEKYRNFTLSFVQLFMHEDDILFEVLLLMFSLPSCAEQQVCEEMRAFQEMKEDVLLHMSHLFNPLHMFHLFLAELHYDHQVLLDYLISKDAGINCAEYILRCLRKICESRDSFMEFSMTEKLMSQSVRKKRKVSQNGPDFQIELSSSPITDSGIPMLLEKECMRKNSYGNKEHGSRGQPFNKAKECLLSLKNSMENLHQKGLFPYNPKVLLRRLTRFHQLCLEHEKC